MFLVMAYFLLGAQLLPEPMMTCYQLWHSGITFSEIWFKIHNLHSRKWIWKCHLQKGSHLFRLQCFNIIDHNRDNVPWYGTILAGTVFYNNIYNAEQTQSASRMTFVFLFEIHFFITMTSYWGRWHLKSQASPLFTQVFIQAQIKKTSKLHITGLCEGNSPVIGEFPAQRASDEENVSIWWRHHVVRNSRTYWLILMA